MITDFRDKKLVEYLEPGQRVLIRFGHGLGDTIMFMPILDDLRRKYPDVAFDLYVECGQEAIWESVPDKDAPGYDHVFSLNFPMSEGSGITKQQRCCLDEVGITPPAAEFGALPACASPLVCCHFQGTALPDSVNCPPETAEAIWNEIVEAGKVPMECHFRHVFHNPRNAPFRFAHNHVRHCEASVRSLVGLLQHSFAFVGVASGPLVAACSIMPQRVLFLSNRHELGAYTQADIPTVDVTQTYAAGAVRAWLGGLS